MVYTHVVKELRNPARSPLDVLASMAAGRSDRVRDSKGGAE